MVGRKHVDTGEGAHGTCCRFQGTKGLGSCQLGSHLPFAKMRSHFGLDATAQRDGMPQTTLLMVAKVLRYSADHRISKDGEECKAAKTCSDKRHFCGTALVKLSEEEETNSVIEKKLSFAGADLKIKTKTQIEFFCKTLTASDTSTHGGLSMPLRVAEKIFSALVSKHQVSKPFTQ